MTHRPWFPAVLFGVAVLFATEPVHAQFLGGWLPPEKSLRVTASVSAQHNDRWFCGEGRAHCQTGERAVFSDLTSREESRTTSFYLRLQATPWNFLGFSAEIPWHRIRYERYIASMSRPIDALDSNGVGDTYVTARAGRVFGMWGVTAGYGLELPTGDFTIDAFRVPLGQGTLNHVVFLEAGRSLWPAPAYLEAGLLGRFRGTYTTEDGVDAHWGNEFVWRLDGGWRFAGPWWVKLETKGYRSAGFSTNIPGEPKGDHRSLWALFGSLQYEGAGILAEVWAQAPLAGRNTPADPTFGVSFTYTR